MKPALLLAVFTSILAGSHGAKILAVLPFFGKSHHIFTTAVLKNLIQQGHHVVEYGPTPSFKSSQNYTHVEIHTSTESMEKTWTYENFTEIASKSKYSLGLSFIFVWFMTHKVCEETFQQDRVKQLLNSNEHFDLVITESSFGQESMVVFGHKFKAPTITLQGFTATCTVNMDTGNALSIASIPDFGALVGTDQMTFTERFMNFISTIITLVAYYTYQLPSHDKLIKQYYNKDAPHLTEMVSNISLYFINTHPAIEYVRPYTPNLIPIGGITISADRISLPKNIQKFMDEATEGVIYFSLGTVVPAHIMPKEVLQIYVNVFKKLKQRVLWKIGLETIPGLPKNVLITKWVPQPGVLAHQNCVLFITHGGQFSLQDALYAGVPTIAIPFFGDQPFNAKLSEHRGFGETLDFRTLSEETLGTALTNVLNTPKYRENAKRLSRIFRDRPISPADSVTYWVEYVIRHGGAHHLRPAAAYLSWYQLALLDVIAAVIATLLIVLLVIYMFLKTILSYFFVKKNQIPTGKKKN